MFIGTLYPLALEVADRRQDLGRPALLQSDLRAADGAAAAGACRSGRSWPGSAATSLRRRAAPAGRRPALPSWRSWLALALIWRGPWLAPFGIALGVWVVAGALSEWASRVKLFAAGCDEVWRRARDLPRSAYGTHAGARRHRPHGDRHRRHHGLAERAHRRHEARRAHRRSPATSSPSAASRRARGPNYRSRSAVFDVTRGGAPVTELEPAKRLYDAPRQPTTEAGIHVASRGDLYVVLGDAAGRRRLRRAPLLQSAGAPHLDRRRRHGPRRRPLALRPPPARRRPADARAAPPSARRRSR